VQSVYQRRKVKSEQPCWFSKEVELATEKIKERKADEMPGNRERLNGERRRKEEMSWG
jgi:hypothetical protein